MAIQKHLLVLHQRKRQNANAIWLMILGCLSLCCFTSLCLLFNDWSLLPQAYNPKPLILGDALFDLNPDLFPFHQAEIGLTKKQNFTRLKGKYNGLHRVENDGGGQLSSSSSLQQHDGDQINTIMKNRGMTNSASRNENIFGFITVLMRKRSTNNGKRPSFKMQKSLSLGSGERKEMKKAKERKTLLQAKETQSQPSSPSSNSVKHLQIEIKPILRSGSKKRFKQRERVSFAVNERVRHIRDRNPTNKDVLYAADGQIKVTLNEDHSDKQSHGNGLVKRSGRPPLHRSKNQDGPSNLSAYPRRRRTSRSTSPANSNRESPERLSNTNQRRRASFNNVHDIISRQSVTEEQPLSQYQSNWKGDKNSQARISRLRGRNARTPSPPSSRGEHVIFPSHTLSPFHEKKQEGTSRGRRRSFDRVASWLDKLGDEYSPPSPSSPFAEAQRSSFRSKDSIRRHRISFEGIDEDHSVTRLSNSPRIVSIRHEGPSEGLKDVLQPEKGSTLQKRSTIKDEEVEANQMMKRCFGLACLSFLKSKAKNDEEYTPLRSQSFQEEKAKFSPNSQMTAPQRQTIHSSIQRKQSPLSLVNRERDLRKYTLIKNTFSSGGAGIKVTKRAFSADEKSTSSNTNSPLEHSIPRKSILRQKDRNEDGIQRQLKHVTFSDETKFTPSSNRPRPRSRLNSRLTKQRIFYEGRKQVHYPSSSSSSSSTSKLQSLPISVQSIPSIEINRGSRRGYVSSNTRFTSKQGQRSSNITRRSERTSPSSINSDRTSPDNDTHTGSTLQKRASTPTKPSLRATGKQKDSSKRVQFKEVTKADIHELPESPRSPGSHGKQEHGMFATNPVVLFDASKQHQSTPTISTTTTSKPTVRSSTTSTPSSTSRLERSLHAKHGGGGGWMNKSYSREGKFKKREILEKRGQKRKSPLRYVASSESFIHTNDHHAKFGSLTTSAIGPTKKIKQQSPQKTSSIASDLSPSHLGFAGLHINSNSISKSLSSQKSNSASLTNTSNKPSLSRSDSLRSTGSSSFRGSVETDSAQTTSKPSSAHAQRAEWWHSAHSGTSSGSGVPFVYK